MTEIRNSITRSDRISASERLIEALKEGEQSVKEKGWIMADEVEAGLEHD